METKNQNKLVRKRKQAFATAGFDRDPNREEAQANQKLVEYSIPGSEDVRLLDPDEHLLRVEGVDELDKLVDELAEVNEEIGIPKKALGGMALGIDVVVGDPNKPNSCYRFPLSDIKNGKIIALDNVEGVETTITVEGVGIPKLFAEQATLDAARKVHPQGVPPPSRAQRLPFNQTRYFRRHVEIDPQENQVHLVRSPEEVESLESLSLNIPGYLEGFDGKKIWKFEEGENMEQSIEAVKEKGKEPVIYARHFEEERLKNLLVITKDKVISSKWEGVGEEPYEVTLEEDSVRVNGNDISNSKTAKIFRNQLMGEVNEVLEKKDESGKFLFRQPEEKIEITEIPETRQIPVYKTTNIPSAPREIETTPSAETPSIISSVAGAAKGATKGAAKSGIAKGAGKVAGWIAGIVSSETGPLAMAIKKFVQKVTEKVVRWIEDHKELAAGLGLLGAGLATGSVIIASTGMAISLFALGTTYVIGAIIEIVAPIVWILLIIPMIIIFILFIINTSAFMVPPGPRLGLTTGAGLPDTEDSDYIDVNKTPVPLGGFANIDLITDPDGDGQEGRSITYNVQVDAVTQSLTNIVFDYECIVVNSSGVSHTCPTTSPAPPYPAAPNEIVAGSPFTFSYTQNFRGYQFRDSIITDSISVTANHPDQTRTRETVWASINFGQLPETCPQGWPVDETTGATYLVTQGPETTFSHTFSSTFQNVEAIDVGSTLGNFDPSQVVIATHFGEVINRQLDQWGGLWVAIETNCAGHNNFRTWHVHFETFDPNIQVGTIVTRGTPLGLMGQTGQASGYHDHYEFRVGGSTSYYYNVHMGFPYIPVNVPRGCVEAADCGWIAIP